MQGTQSQYDSSCIIKLDNHTTFPDFYLFHLQLTRLYLVLAHTAL